MSTVGAKTGLEKVTTKRRVIEKSVVLFAGSNRAPRTHERVSKYQQAEANCDRRASRIAARGSMPEPGFRTPIGPVRETSVTSHAKKATRNPTWRRKWIKMSTSKSVFDHPPPARDAARPEARTRRISLKGSYVSMCLRETGNPSPTPAIARHRPSSSPRRIPPRVVLAAFLGASLFRARLALISFLRRLED